jgi:NAD(P)-dependent dehydrogenase (short-subunit alcohol dehydrogenase family)
MEMMRIDGDTALVTGGAGILGKQFCAGLIEAGATVVIVDLDADSAQSAAATLGPNAHGFACDVSDPHSVKDTVGAICDQFGGIDILLNNAATKTDDVREFFKPFEDYSIDTWREVMSVNIDGMFLMAQAVGKAMISGKRTGRIVQTASIYGLVGPDSRIYEGSDYLGGPINTPAVYSASKAAVIGLTKWLATYWAQNNINVNCLVPGGVSSGQNSKFSDLYSDRVPMNRMAEAEEMVAPMLFLASREASYVTGQVLAADGGWTAW